jgi:hypothetical protein
MEVAMPGTMLAIPLDGNLPIFVAVPGMEVAMPGTMLAIPLDGLILLDISPPVSKKQILYVEKLISLPQGLESALI